MCLVRGCKKLRVSSPLVGAELYVCSMHAELGINLSSNMGNQSNVSTGNSRNEEEGGDERESFNDDICEI